jgi:hypothetical protein
MIVLICATGTDCQATTAIQHFEATVSGRACAIYQQETEAQHGGVENYLVRAFKYTVQPGEVIKVSCAPGTGANAR